MFHNAFVRRFDCKLESLQSVSQDQELEKVMMGQLLFHIAQYLMVSAQKVLCYYVVIVRPHTVYNVRYSVHCVVYLVLYTVYIVWSVLYTVNIF